MTNELSTWFNAAAGALQHMNKWPADLLLLVVLVAVGVLLKIITSIVEDRKLRSKLRHAAIPATVLCLGAIINWHIGSVKSVDPEQTHPEFVLALRGFIIGAGAILVHALILKRFEKHVPILAGRTGDTELLEKP